MSGATWQILEGEARDLLRSMEPASFDAIVTDPPYGLEFMGKQWDKLATPRPGNLGGFADGNKPSFERVRRHLSAMQSWHHAWAVEALRVLKPGAHLVAFGGTRTYHRLACALEDAGFEIRDSLMWIYGSGFPKSLSVEKAIDGHLGAERPVIGRAKGVGTDRGYGGGFATEYAATQAATQAATEWRGWGTALKPAQEPIVLARKPLVGTVAANVLAHGTGALNVDGCRVETPDKWEGREMPQAPDGVTWGGALNRSSSSSHDLGRWPPNLALTHSIDCRAVGYKRVYADGHHPAQRGAGGLGTAGHAGQEGLGERHADGELVEVFECAEGCPVAELDRQSGEFSSGAHPTRRGPDKLRDFGGASRFFPRFRYVAKASGVERDGGLDGLEAREAQKWNPSGIARHRHEAGTVRPLRNIHPTVKPIALMRWLCRLVTPPKGLILDPFAGSGSTVIAALQEGFRCIGIEREPKYVEIARRRVEEDMPLFNRKPAA